MLQLTMMNHMCGVMQAPKTKKRTMQKQRLAGDTATRYASNAANDVSDIAYAALMQQPHHHVFSHACHIMCHIISHAPVIQQ
jgi:hypothetical protein